AAVDGQVSMPDINLLNVRRAREGPFSSTAPASHSFWTFPVYVLVIVALTLLDFFTIRLNPSIIYIALLVIAFSSRWSVAWVSPLEAAIFLVSLTYLGYFFGRGAGAGWGALLTNYRLANRTFAALTLCTIAGLFGAVRHARSYRVDRIDGLDGLLTRLCEPAVARAVNG